MSKLNTPSKNAETAYKKFREKNNESLKYLRLLEIDWPCSIVIIVNLCEYLTDAILIGDKPVIYRAINYGLSLYSKNMGNDDPARLSAFVQGVIDSVGRDLEDIAIFDEKTNSVWSPLSKSSFYHWLQDEARIERVSELKVTRSESSADEVSKKIFFDVLEQPHQEIVSEKLTWCVR